jgi:long-chain fatty acid transport protein
MRKLIAAFLIAPAAAFAGGYAIPNENARSLGLSQADVAAQTGPEAAYQNAAALAGQQGVSATGNVEMINNQTYWTDPNLGNATTVTNLNFPPFLAVAWGDKLSNEMAYGLGIAFLVPGGGSIFWPNDWQGAGRIQSVDQKVYLTQFSGGFQPLPWFKIGASLLWYQVTEKLVQKLNFIDTAGTATLGLGGGGVTFGLSGEIKIPNVPLTIGIDYRHQAPMTLSGNAHFDNVPPNFSSQLQDQPVTEDIVIPNQLFAGLAYDIPMAPENGGLKVMGTFTFERWERYTSDTYVGTKPPEAPLVITVPRDYNNAYVYRFAGEWSHVPFHKPLTLRLGFQRSISDQPTDTVSPTLTDGNSWVFSGGVGYDFTKQLRADLGYQLAIFDWVTATGVEAFPGSYKTHVNLLSIGVTYRTAGL